MMNLLNSKTTIFLMLFISLSVLASGSESVMLGKVAYLSGKARIKEKDGIKWDELKNGMRIHDAQKLETAGQSKCEISFRGKSIVRIDENTSIEIKENINGIDKVKIEDGDIWLAHLLPETKSAIEIETPSSACSIRGTVYRLSCNNNQTTYRCYKGTIKVNPTSNDSQTKHEESFFIHKGEELILVRDFMEYIKTQKREFNDFINEKMDAFEQYNQEQMQSFNESVNSDMKDFKKMNGYYVRYKKFDEKKDMETDWVKWNIERDKELESLLMETQQTVD